MINLESIQRATPHVPQEIAGQLASGDENGGVGSDAALQFGNDLLGIARDRLLGPARFRFEVHSGSRNGCVAS